MKSVFPMLVVVAMICLGQQAWADILRYPPANLGESTMEAMKLSSLPEAVSEANMAVPGEELPLSPEEDAMQTSRSIFVVDTHEPTSNYDSTSTPIWLLFLILISIAIAMKANEAFTPLHRIHAAYARVYWHVFDPLQF